MRGVLLLLGVLLHTACAVPQPYPVDVLLPSGPRLVRAVARHGGLARLCESPEALHAAELRAPWRTFVEALCTAHLRPRQMLGASLPLRVVVVGAGPAGLLSAITAYQRGAAVVVIEKRRAYARDVWFDISDGVWGASLQLLDAWGIFALHDELDCEPVFDKMDWTGTRPVAQVLAVRAHALERFLAQTCLLLGIDIRYGDGYERLAGSGESAVLTTRGHVLPFDVLVGADGGRSRVRHDLGIVMEQSADVTQTSLFLRFRTCPTVSDDACGSWDVTQHVPEVMMMYRRFFQGQCDLQLTMAGAAAATLTESTIDWNMVLRVCRLAVGRDAFADVAQLRAAVSRVQVVVSDVSRAAEATVCLAHDQQPCHAVGVLVGDAVFPAHYRLGIGANNAIDSLFNFGLFLSKLGGSARDANQWLAAVEEKQVMDEERMEHVWRHQMRVMWLESVCSMHVFQEHERAVVPLEDQDALQYREPVDPFDLFVVRTSTTTADAGVNGTHSSAHGAAAADFTLVLPLHEAAQLCENRLNVSRPWSDAPDPGIKAVKRVFAVAERGNPQSVLDTIDAFGQHDEWMMNVGEIKGRWLSDEVAKLPAAAAVLELGAYIGYSAVRIAAAMRNATELHPQQARQHLHSVEVSPSRARLARHTIAFAGLRDYVTVLEGTLAQVLARVPPVLALAFFVHKKEAYLPDLLLLERTRRIRSGTVIVGDNVVNPGAPDFRQYLNTAPHYRTIEHHTTLEYTDEPDLVTVSLALSDPAGLE